LGFAPESVDPDALVIAIGVPEMHAPMPWSALRWNFVSGGLLARTPHLWWAGVESIAQALRDARSVRWQSNAHVDHFLEDLKQKIQAMHPGPKVTVQSEPALFVPVEPYCDSFTKWWRLSRIAT
jgi:hypothetical protein